MEDVSKLVYINNMYIRGCRKVCNACMSACLSVCVYGYLYMCVDVCDKSFMCAFQGVFIDVFVRVVYAAALRVYTCTVICSYVLYVGCVKLIHVLH